MGADLLRVLVPLHRATRGPKGRGVLRAKVGSCMGGGSKMLGVQGWVGEAE